MRFLLRVEGVNLSNVIDDTDQLSVRRGGGLMILNASPALASLLPSDLQGLLNPIATGASIGLFEFDAASESDADQIRDRVVKVLRSQLLDYLTIDGKPAKLPLLHGTFVVDVESLEKHQSAQQAEQMLVARNRWRQLQEPTLSLDDLWCPGDEPCEFDRTRVGNEVCYLEDNRKAAVSSSAKDRREYGRGARQKFYDQELEHTAAQDPTLAAMLPLRFTNSLQELGGLRESDRPRDRVESPDGELGDANDALPSRLKDKLSVFYVDGNGFGKKGRGIFEKHGVAGYTDWSNAIREHHRTLLAGLIKLTNDDDLWRSGDDIRLETLVWGGDEILWVVPAWKGWEIAKWFFEQKHQVAVLGQKYELTYGCGLTFCHAKAPIKNVMTLAKSLGDVAKDASPNSNRLAYEVLESVDDVCNDLEDHRKRFVPRGSSTAELVVDPSSLSKHWELLNSVATSRDFPRRQLYTHVKNWRAGGAIEKSEKRLETGLGDAIEEASTSSVPLTTEQITQQLNNFKHDFGQQVCWLHLQQVIPYLLSYSGSRPTIGAGS